MAEETGIVKVDVNTMLAAETGTTYCTIKADPADRAKAAKVYNALNNPEYRVADFINKEIAVADVLIEIAEVMSEETGEISQVPRVVLIDDDGKAYQSVSIGMFNAVKNAIKVFGEPTWDPALTFKIKQRAVKNGSMLTADIVG